MTIVHTLANGHLNAYTSSCACGDLEFANKILGCRFKRYHRGSDIHGGSSVPVDSIIIYMFFYILHLYFLFHFLSSHKSLIDVIYLSLW